MPKSSGRLLLQGLGSLGILVLGLFLIVCELRQNSLVVLAGVIVLVAGAVGTIATVVEWQRSAQPERRWYQFSLRTLLLVTALAAACCGWLASESRRVKQQRRTVQLLDRFAGSVRYDYQERGAVKPPGPTWLHELVGREYFVHITAVHLEDHWSVPEGYIRECLSAVGALPRIEELHLHGSSVTDADLKHLQRCKTLKLIDLRVTRTTEEGVKKLRQALPNCKIGYRGLGSAENPECF